jgi:hypothetical protein
MMAYRRPKIVGDNNTNNNNNNNMQYQYTIIYICMLLDLVAMFSLFIE